MAPVPMKQKARKSLPERTKSGSVVDPCFHCGLIFARRDEYLQHMERYHQPKNQDGRNDRFRCHECDQAFGDDEKGFKEHLLFHDLGKILGALRRSEMIRKRVQPLLVRAPPAETTSITRNDASVWDLDDKQPGMTCEVALTGKGKAGRPRSKSVFTTTSPKVAATPTAIPSHPTAPVSTPSEPVRKRRRVSNEPPAAQTTPVQSITGPIAASSPMAVLSSAPSTPIATQATEATAATATDPKATPTSGFVPPPSPSLIAALQLPASSPSSSSAQRHMPPLPALQSACPNCNQNLGKPWHLVDHMIQQHDAQLMRLHRMLKKPDGAIGTTVTSQMFSDRHCPFCQLTYADMQASLLHVVRTHRSRLFECPDNGECVLTCELMCAIGPDASQKKFTISVKVKRKTNE